jgi:multiple antibiotic resistance protein
MHISWVDILVLFLVTMGPTKAVVIYAGLTAKLSPAERRKVAIKAVGVATIVTLLFLWGGKGIIDAIHVTIPALKMAGGVILGLFALGLVLGGSHKEESEGGDIAVFPLALPLMASPQGIVILITFATTTQDDPATNRLLYVLLAVTMAVNLIFLLLADKILKFISPSALMVVMKIAGVLLTALAIQLIFWGLQDIGVLHDVMGKH